VVVQVELGVPVALEVLVFSTVTMVQVATPETVVQGVTAVLDSWATQLVTEVKAVLQPTVEQVEVLQCRVSLAMEVTAAMAVMATAVTLVRMVQLVAQVVLAVMQPKASQALVATEAMAAVEATVQMV
jgi:hypothetical protein